ncbi:MFS transporter [Ralstonia pseudosolanacearum]|uniref:MFS transporter n=1 Tax=Ralstonia pseudosolanacearum TaxID=1310165 RepID=UPI0007D7FDB0|nr:MFS transporter [Ralstonia pseudosolanacearum]MDC6293660.1 MFS transporter [Ralstonia pseudosolanacearum]MDD7791528.1 MFS transporter [Ralstonia pseudosolanacearum]MDN3369646.1 MFS transporter [Ralstonia pseudosolanacearum]OAK92635.1 macrolide-efflux protein [Ralstonia pseudosolanacearum]QOK86144.1 MFS transporter [Ralstonia pseudosolanacearum]
MTMLSSVPGYRALMAARVISSGIVWVDFTLIFSLLSYHWHADAVTIGVASALYGLPGLLLGPFFGALADRLNPVTILIVSYLARCLSSVLLMVAPDVNIFVLLVLIKGLANLGAAPAEQVVVRSMLSKAQFVSNASIMTTIDQLTKICAPLLGAGMASLHHPVAGFGLAGTLCVGLLRKQVDMSKRDEASRQAPRHLQALLSLVRDNATFRMAFIAAIAQTAVLALYDPLLALFLKGKGMPTAVFGMIVSSTAGGAILGALVFKRVHSRSEQGTATMGLAAFGLTVAIPGVLAVADIAIPAGVLLAFWIANGCFYGLTAMSFGVTMQQQCPPQTIGTVSATARSVQLAVLVLGPLAGAALSGLVGIPLVFVLSGVLAMLVAGALWGGSQVGAMRPFQRLAIRRKRP